MNRGLMVLIGSVVVVIILMAAFGTVWQFVWHALYPTQPIPQGTVPLREWLPIMVALLALGVAAFGGGTYYILSHSVQRQVENRINVARLAISCNEGYSYWLQYKNKVGVFFLDLALDATKDAWALHGFKLDEKERDSEELICTIRNNWGYYIAEKKRLWGTVTVGEETLAKKFAAYIETRIGKFPDHADEWAKTIRFVREQFHN